VQTRHRFWDFLIAFSVVARRSKPRLIKMLGIGHVATASRSRTISQNFSRWHSDYWFTSRFDWAI